MAETATRLLRLLSLLQDQRARTGSELADHLGVTGRTLRHDIARLRELGYPIHAERGSTGGYRLGQGASMPPLLLDDDEAVAVAVAIGVAEEGATGIADIEESTARALAKLTQIMPKRLQRKVKALRTATAVGPAVTGSREPDAPVAAAVLDTIAAAVRDNATLRIDGVQVEPYRLISWQRRWYLVTYDLDDHAWRALPVASAGTVVPGTRRFAPRLLPDDDLVAFVLREIASTGWKVHARITVLAPAPVVVARINPTVGIVEAVDEHTSVLVTGADTLETIAIYVSMLGMDFRLDGPPELVEHVRVLGERYLAAIVRP
ncbi:Predicted DNA-binding transcriptional regulator YafY, contains an HTH and WYL domains [Actinokineospora alba]|uniref:Predicted DNA-binding transcriptional regulator YafY, contains an HTH and WYL domains n=1 Tax=Actinokineospora alba TaxID=504798 RepID=A0A1H0TLK6_9PSEU|nr:WYL domain-containing protein [Actinokineospora alba]TDP70589.1 putative DNA-binding transcriptional regulator YafY [Actinokineospora alba]SDJ11117.1 Predicted DNA-binding transcriptional regulator YafY, contains an HTH and WYL domains [Actinokineospora alba]SDP54859.1 Predicted DNA-binding transcriptional regulator YafY, contains an HTH and WYL domains [Actinokineospora alba]